MRIVAQRGRHDCGVCALATVLGLSWRSAVDAIWPGKQKRTYGTWPRELVMAARRLGHSAPRSRLTLARPRKWWAVPHPSLVKVVPKGGNRKTRWHWVVWDGTRVIDAQANETFLPRNAPWKPLSYIVVRKNG